MGLLFNSRQTTKMLAVVNDAFDSDPTTGALSINSWRTPPGLGLPAPMEYFNALSSYKLPLSQIAIQMKIFAGSGKDSPKDKRFQKWLKALDIVGVGDTICAQVYQGLTNILCAEIYFVLVPSSTIAVGSYGVAVGPPLTFTWVITISTVTVDNVPTFVAMYRNNLASRRAAVAKAIRKKKA